MVSASEIAVMDTGTNPALATAASDEGTKVSDVPQDWEVIPLRSIVTSHNSGIFKRKDTYGRGENIIGVADFVGVTRIAGQVFGRVPLTPSEKNLYSLKEGDLLYCESSLVREGIARTLHVTEEGAGTAFAWHTRRYSIDQSRVDAEYLSYYLQSWRARDYLVTNSIQTALTGINTRAYFACPVLVPPICEQKRIAQALRDTETSVEALENLIEKKRLIKQGAMQELLSGRRRLPGFSGEWEKRAFGDVFSFLPTATNSRADLSQDGDAYYVHYGDIHTRFHSHLDFGASELPRIVREKCPRAAALRNGDWIMADASEDTEGVGKAVEVRGLSDNEPAVSGLHTFLLREKAPVFVPGFKGHLGDAEFLRKQYLRVMTGMKVFGVSKTALRELLIPVPSSKEQQALVEVFDDMNADIATLEARLEKARQIKQGMMQELLTGRVRLV